MNMQQNSSLGYSRFVGAQLVARFHRDRATSCAPALRFALWALLLIAPAAHAAEFGRLFYTPEQRAQLDYEYARNVSADGDNSSVVMVNGIVQRRGGGRVVWINGVAQSAGKSDERHPTSVPVSVPGKSRPVEMKVGQKLLLDTPDTTPDAPAK